MKLTLLIIIIGMLFLSSCKSMEAQQKCFNAYIKAIRADPEYNMIRSAASDTVAKWATLNLKTFYGINRTKWQIGSAVFFNEDRSKAVLLLLEIDTVSTATFDYVKMLAAEKKEGSWCFFSQSMPTIGFDRTLNSSSTSKKTYTFEELSDISQKEIIHGGYYKKGTCIVDYGYVNGWFKNPLAEYHKEFLKNKAE